MHSARIAAVSLLINFLIAGCAERSGTGKSVAIPIVSLSCGTAHCHQNIPAKAYIVYTTSSCSNASFGETVAGSTTLTCNGGGCSGTVTNFTDGSGSSANTMPDGFYSICVVLDFDSNYIGTAVTGDTTGALNNTQITNGTTTRSVTSFADL
ncbi:hypothetical protein BH10BDE1_BH10BDE1_19590 [soil metagenome]